MLLSAAQLTVFGRNRQRSSRVVLGSMSCRHPLLGGWCPCRGCSLCRCCCVWLCGQSHAACHPSGSCPAFMDVMGPVSVCCTPHTLHARHCVCL